MDPSLPLDFLLRGLDFRWIAPKVRIIINAQRTMQTFRTLGLTFHLVERNSLKKNVKQYK